MDNLKIGDNLLSAGEIIHLEAALCTGLVAPITRAGTLVVDGAPTSDCKCVFWRSCVFRLERVVPDGVLAERLGQPAAHTLLLPLRILHWIAPGWDFWHANRKDGMHPLMAWGQYLLNLES